MYDQKATVFKQATILTAFAKQMKHSKYTIRTTFKLHTETSSSMNRTKSDRKRETMSKDDGVLEKAYLRNPRRSSQHLRGDLLQEVAIIKAEKM